MISQAGRNRIETHARGTTPYDRTLVFFDAIYAFALTLLVTTIELPTGDSWRSLQALSDDGLDTQILGFLISFAVIAVFWRVNVRVVGRLTTLTPQMIFTNIVAAGLIIFIPFTTEAFSDSTANEYVLPVVFYALNVALLSMAMIAMRELAIRQDTYENPPSPRERRIMLLDDISSPIVILLSIPVAILFGGVAAHYWWLLLIITGPLSAKLAQRAIGPGASEPD